MSPDGNDGVLLASAAPAGLLPASASAQGVPIPQVQQPPTVADDPPPADAELYGPPLPTAEDLLGSTPDGNSLLEFARPHPDLNLDDLVSDGLLAPNVAVESFALGPAKAVAVFARIEKRRNPNAYWGSLLAQQVPYQPPSIARDLSLYGLNPQPIMADPLADLLVNGTINTAVAVGTQELSKRALDPTINGLISEHRRRVAAEKVRQYMLTGDESLLRGLRFEAAQRGTGENIVRVFDVPQSNLRTGTPMSNEQYAGIAFLIPAAQMGRDAAVSGMEDLTVDAGFPEAGGVNENYWVDLASNAAALCVGVAVPISIAARARAWDACYWPPGQSAVAQLVADPPPDAGPVTPILAAAADVCFDQNITRDAAEQFICGAGRGPGGPDDQPPASPGQTVFLDGWTFHGLQPGMAFDPAQSTAAHCWSR